MRAGSRGVGFLVLFLRLTTPGHGGGAPHEQPGSVIFEIDGLLEEGDVNNAAIEGCIKTALELSKGSAQGDGDLARAAARGASGLCRGKFDIDAALRHPELLESGASRSLKRYFECKALAAENPDLCGGLKPLEEIKQAVARTPVESCRTFFREGMLVKSVMLPGPKSAGQCREFLAALGGIGPELVSRLCSALAASDPDLKSLCAQAAPELSGIEKIESEEGCLNRLRLVRGEQSCGGSLDEAGRTLCEFSSALRAARSAGAAQACGKSVLCRALMEGEGDGCRPLLDEARSKFCTADRRARFEVLSESYDRLLGENAALLVRLDILFGSIEPGSDPRIDPLRTRRSALLRRHSRLMEKFRSIGAPGD